MNYAEIDKKLKSEFLNRKLYAEEKAGKNLLYVKKNSPYLKLKNLENNLAFSYAKAKTEKSGDAEKLKELLSDTRKKIKEILKKMNLTEADLVPNYKCKKCNDSGITDGTMCECFKKERNRLFVKASGFDKDNLKTFASFDTKICKNEVQAKNLEKLKILLENWAKNYPAVKKINILLSGKTGTGKTFLTECLASEMIAKDNLVCFLSAFDLNNMMLKYHTTFDFSKETILSPALDCDILFIDDLGTEPMLKNVTENYLFLILSERERQKKPTVISTNLLPENILDRYGERIYSRLTSKLTSAVLHLDGADLRQK